MVVEGLPERLGADAGSSSTSSQSDVIGVSTTEFFALKMGDGTVEGVAVELTVLGEIRRAALLVILAIVGDVSKQDGGKEQKNKDEMLTRELFDAPRRCFTRPNLNYRFRFKGVTRFLWETGEDNGIENTKSQQKQNKGTSVQ